MINRSDLEQSEDNNLATYASRCSSSRGRVFSEEEHPYRTAYMRDRDRIIHCAAFRRLEYKTQVFVYNEGDYYRTRLTHTLEVAQISRAIARALSLNEDLCEASALCHDIGHPPFGHAGERALNEIMQDDGGFEHNLHALKIVDKIEHHYLEFRGLNLSWETREAIAKHAKNHDHPSLKEFKADPNASLEAQVSDLADSIAYSTHDLDDGLASGLIDESSIDDVALWKKAASFTKRTEGSAHSLSRYQVMRRIIDAQVGDTIRQTENNLRRFSIQTADQVRALREKVVDLSADLKRERKELSAFLRENVYNHRRIIRMEEKALAVVERLFNAYERRPELMPQNVYKQIDNVGKRRLVCDYIAGMTDRFAMEEYKKLFDPMYRV